MPAVLPLNDAGAPFSFSDAQQLSIALRNGDQAAFRFLHREWNRRIVRYCFALAAGDDTFAMEIVQATYLRIFRQLRPVSDEASLWNWIACSARSAAIDLRRVGGRYRQTLARFAGWLGFGAGRPAPAAGQADLLTALDKALATLTDDERSLIEARYFERLPLESIAHDSRASVRAVEGRLARVRQRLRLAIAALLRNENI